MRRYFAGPFDVSQPPQRFAKNLRFVLKLRFVGDVLVIAPAAHAEMRAGGHGAAC